MYPRRGEVWWVAFDPSVGGEIQKTRPAVILSNNAANASLNRLVVVPLSSKTSRIYPGETIVSLNGEQRKAMVSQITTAAKERLSSRFGLMSLADLSSIEAVLLRHLGIRR